MDIKFETAPVPELDYTEPPLSSAKEMNSKYKETSESGLAVSVTLC